MLPRNQKSKNLILRASRSAMSSEVASNLNQSTKITFTAVISLSVTSPEGAISNE